MRIQNFAFWGQSAEISNDSSVIETMLNEGHHGNSNPNSIVSSVFEQVYFGIASSLGSPSLSGRKGPATVLPSKRVESYNSLFMQGNAILVAHNFKFGALTI